MDNFNQMLKQIWIHKKEQKQILSLLFKLNILRIQQTLLLWIIWKIIFCNPLPQLLKIMTVKKVVIKVGDFNLILILFWILINKYNNFSNKQILLSQLLIFIINGGSGIISFWIHSHGAHCFGDFGYLVIEEEIGEL